MTEREALNLALEALETLMIERGSIYDKAITAIKEALAQRTWVGLTDVLDFIEEFTGAERDRHPMFSDGYDLALSHVKELVEAKLKEKNT